MTRLATWASRSGRYLLCLTTRHNVFESVLSCAILFLSLTCMGVGIDIPSTTPSFPPIFRLMRIPEHTRKSTHLLHLCCVYLFDYMIAVGWSLRRSPTSREFLHSTLSYLSTPFYNRENWQRLLLVIWFSPSPPTSVYVWFYTPKIYARAGKAGLYNFGIWLAS